ncbi:MAG: beta-ketoacyl synthase N-terminal-like domain-containing protein [Myxococcota bacterium]
MGDTAHRVAVVGLGARFPGAPDAATLWDNVARGHDAIGEASPRRLDPRFAGEGGLPTRRGGFLGDEVTFDAARFGVMPRSVPATDADQLLALEVAAAALSDAGLDPRDLAGRTVGVILGRGGYLTPAMTRLGRRARDAEQLADILRQVLPDLPEDDVRRVREAFAASAGAPGPDAAMGVVSNLTASRIANRLDLHGPAYTLDAACASSLVAVEHAVRELRAGRCDLVLAGGVHLVDDVPFWSVFDQLGAMSATGTIRPFDRRADGLLIGEGVGVLALKRLDHARRDGDRIYAVLHGVGTSSDGRAATVMVPRSPGQVLALQRAWSDAGLDPRDVGLVEAHGTATPTGDAAELATLREVFGDEGDTIALGSIKSMIGHAMPAAGAAGLVKAVLAVHHGVLPPSLHCEEPHPALAEGRLEVLAQARPWEGDERLCGVNAFGFGGINAHVVVGAHGAAARTAGRRAAANPLDRADADVLALAAADPTELLSLLDRGVRRGGQGPCRLALVDPTPDRLARARRVVERGEPWTGRGGMWFRRRGLVDVGGGIVFVFPGIEAAFSPETETITARFGYPALALPQGTADLEAVGHGVVQLGLLLDRVVRDLGVVPATYAGHSVGEWAGMIASGLVPADDVDGFLQRIPFKSPKVPDVLFAAAGCAVDVAERAIAGLGGIAVSHDNCPHQVILCGHSEPVGTARERLLADGVLCQILPFRSGFHSPLFAEYLAPHAANLEALELRLPHTPLWSATTVSPYPSEPEAVRALVLEHLVAPLRFRELVRTLYDAGARVFVQLGWARWRASWPTPSAASLTSPSPPRRTAAPGSRSCATCCSRCSWRRSRGPARSLAEREGPRGGAPGAAPGGPRRAQRGPRRAARPADGSPLSRALAEAEAALLRGPATCSGARRPRPAPWRTRRRLSVAIEPALRDHAFFPSPPAGRGRRRAPGGAHDHDRGPADRGGRGRAPGQVVVELADLRALRWIAVEPPVEVRIEGADAGDGWTRVVVDDADGSGPYAEARLRLADRYPTPPARASPRCPTSRRRRRAPPRCTPSAGCSTAPPTRGSAGSTASAPRGWTASS